MGPRVTIEKEKPYKLRKKIENFLIISVQKIKFQRPTEMMMMNLVNRGVFVAHIDI